MIGNLSKFLKKYDLNKKEHWKGFDLRSHNEQQHENKVTVNEQVYQVCKAYREDAEKHLDVYGQGAHQFTKEQLQLIASGFSDVDTDSSDSVKAESEIKGEAENGTVRKLNSF